jgi:hypothetical protein
MVVSSERAHPTLDAHDDKSGALPLQSTSNELPYAMSYRTVRRENQVNVCHPRPQECRGECAQPASDYGDGVSGRRLF